MLKLKLLDLYVYGLLVIILLIVVHAPLSVGLGTLLPDMSLWIKAWKEILLALLTIVAVVLVSRRKMWTELSRDWLIRLSGAYACLHILLLPYHWQGGNIAAAGLGIDLRHILMMLLCYLAIRLAPEYWGRFRRAVVIGAAIVVGFAALQLVMPPDTLKYIGYGDDTIQPYLTIDENPDYIRHSSTLRGPNPLGAYGAGVVLVALAVLSRRSGRSSWPVWLLGAGGLIAVASSFSRSAALALAVGGLVLLLVRYWNKFSWRQAAIAGLVVIVAAGGFMLVRDSHFVSNVILHEDPNESGMVNSNDEHARSLRSGTERMINQPLGDGIGSTGSPSLLGDSPRIIENHYLYVAHETGWLGLVLFVAIYCLVLWRLWLLRADSWALGMWATGIGLAVAALFLPVWADDTVAIVWWGLAGLIMAGRFEQKPLH